VWEQTARGHLVLVVYVHDTGHQLQHRNGLVRNCTYRRSVSRR
jgi:hypothetical protein